MVSPAPCTMPRTPLVEKEMVGARALPPWLPPLTPPAPVAPGSRPVAVTVALTPAGPGDMGRCSVLLLPSMATDSCSGVPSCSGPAASY